MLRFSVVCIGCLVATVSSARADGPFEGPIEPIPEFRWTGFYVGGNGGYGWAADPHNITYNSGDVSGGPDASGGFGGGQIGYNWQGVFSRDIVVGIEADIQGADISDTLHGTTSGGISGFVRQDLDWFGTVRGRVGWAWDRALIYGTGGFAYGEVDDRSVGSGLGETITLRDDSDRTGYVVGGGVEYAIASNISMKIEYQFIDFGDERLTGTSEPSDVFVRSSPIDASFHTVQLQALLKRRRLPHRAGAFFRML
jgi:outer membrane immunogenic protein